MKPDPREQPSYTIAEAACYLDVPAATVRRWSSPRASQPPLIVPPPRSAPRSVLLSFFNLVELHVLAAISRGHIVSLPKVRSALDCRRRELAPEDPHPLLSRVMAADGRELFARRYGELLGLDRAGQASLEGALDAALRRVDRDDRGLPARLYLFASGGMEDARMPIVVEPGLSAGRPAINGTGLVAEIIAERRRAGESIRELARDYGRPPEEIEAAVRFRSGLAA